jgi:hypothetical protein
MQIPLWPLLTQDVNGLLQVHFASPQCTIIQKPSTLSQTRNLPGNLLNDSSSHHVEGVILQVQECSRCMDQTFTSSPDSYPKLERSQNGCCSASHNIGNNTLMSAFSKCCPS